MLQPVEKLEEYNRLVESSRLFLAYLSSPDCGVCHGIKPQIEAYLKEHPEIISAQVDTRYGEIAAQNSIFTIPAVLFYIEGKEMIREARYFSVELLKEKIDRYLALLSD